MCVCDAVTRTLPKRKFRSLWMTYLNVVPSIKWYNHVAAKLISRKRHRHIAPVAKSWQNRGIVMIFHQLRIPVIWKPTHSHQDLTMSKVHYFTTPSPHVMQVVLLGAIIFFCLLVEPTVPPLLPLWRNCVSSVNRPNIVNVESSSTTMATALSTSLQEKR